MNIYQVLAIALILRVAASFRDGWSMRRVRWWPWHVVGWIKRDLIIGWIIFAWLGAPWESLDTALIWLAIALINLVLHKFFYALGEDTVKYFE